MVVVVDESGSMGSGPGSRLDLASKSTVAVLDTLTEKDKVRQYKDRAGWIAIFKVQFNATCDHDGLG